ncbi:hypothetical protein W97_00386 [Coniosporium apollinis CBS 100218]|uniref:7-alpha-hydroxysteroid dehydrogenase n=1 Tax=Coniosporium apollinis (strain CBS 100218) TaxID=1168221 RepID=R7YHA6_CONA1|nr:uncharacterized protein W97_00386 [Coniosporium apollinis CBS 100218]EON61174.1 hypothetical protein W97_00386 [Coniosporium apollinis CBS 100218]
MASKLITIIAGVGPGTGAAVARKFAKTYPVVLMARNPSNYDSLVEEINKSGGKAVGISADISDEASVKKAFGQIAEEFGGEVACAAAVFNASGKFVRKPFLELSPSDFATGYAVSGHGAFLFSQSTLPLLLRSVDQSPQYPPTLIFTGATASLKGGAQMSSFAAGKFALRALAQSLGREFGPKGVHVAHAIIDGVIDIPRTKEWLQGAGPDAKISADAIADAYWFLHTQHRSCFTNEIDIRPFVEKW